jgi:TfoX/Sxy family transcriptional regulator of competence genes
MATRKATVDAVLRALAPANVRAQPMFGEYGIYCDDRFVGVICDDGFFLKVSSVTDQRLSELELAPPYPGAKDWYVIDLADGRDADWLPGVVQATADALPPPGRRRARRRSSG